MATAGGDRAVDGGDERPASLGRLKRASPRRRSRPATASLIG